MNLSLQITAKLAVLFTPFLPFTSQKLFGFLNLEPMNWQQGETDILLPEGHQLNQASLLFERIEDEQIGIQLSKLGTQKATEQPEAMKLPPSKEAVSFAEFQKMDIRVATILEAERVPKTDKLLKLKVDTGLDIRTIVSGIAGYYQPEELSGKKVCVLLNLEPRNIKGIVSQGMILLSENPDGRLLFTEPSPEALNGAPVN